MKARVRAISIAILVISNLLLVGIWAINGYEETWFFATLMLISISTSLPHLTKKDKAQ